ncbi:MAG: alpha/beta fold hydrolase [Myxococcota bacterium]
MMRQRALGIVWFVALAACGGASSQVGPKNNAPAARAPGAPLFAAKETRAYKIEDKGGKSIGRTYSTFTTSADGDLEVVTRVETTDSGETVGVEHATTFRKDLSPIRYKRLSSLEGRTAMEFKSDGVEIVRERGGQRIPGERRRTPLLPEDDPMVLAILIDDLRIKPGQTGVLDVLAPIGLSKEAWPVQMFADASGQRVVSLPSGRAVLAASGAIERLELGSRVYVYDPAPPKAPEVRYTQPLAYQKPLGSRWKDQELRIPVRDGTLAGALSVPEGGGKPAPLVIFISDRGEHDRSGFLGTLDYGTWEIFDHLADHGVAVLRLDDRGTGASVTTLEEKDISASVLANDARTAIDSLARNPAIDPDRIFLMGHGFGGWIAMSIAPKVHLAGLILMSTPSRGLSELLGSESVKNGKEGEAERRGRIELLAMQGQPAAAAEVGPDRLRVLNNERALLLDLAAMDVKAMAAEIKIPVAVFQGLKDFEVSWKADAEPLVEALKKGAGKDRAKLYAYDHTDHLLKEEAKTSSRERYADRSRHVEPRFLADLIAFIGDKRAP